MLEKQSSPKEEFLLPAKKNSYQESNLQNNNNFVSKSYSKNLRLLALNLFLLFTLFLVRPVPDFIPWLQALQFTLVFLVGLVSRQAYLYIIPLSLFISPMFLSGSLQLTILAFLFSEELLDNYKKLEPSVLKSFFRFLYLAFIPSCFLGFYKSFDYRIITSIFSEAGLWGVYNYLLMNKLSWFDSLQFVVALLLFGLFTRYFTSFLLEQKNINKFYELKFTYGLFAGIFFSALVLLLQIKGFNYFSFNRNPFFISEGRFQAGFTDPNAFGVFSASLIPFLLYFYNKTTSKILFLSILTLTFSGFWSGSRTFFIALVLILAATAFYKYKSHLSKIFILSVSLLSFCIILGYPELNLYLQNIIQIPTLSRVLESMNWNTAISSIESKLIFSKIAIYSWSISPIFGIGFGHFYENQNLYAENALNSETLTSLNGWRDNANNFYLQSLSEAGALGFFFLCCASALLFYLFNEIRKVNKDKEVLMILFSLSLLILLQISGPHFYFTEISALFLIILSFLLTIFNSKRLMSVTSIILRNRVFYSILIVSSFLSINFSSDLKKDALKGFYQKEETPGGFYEAWSVKDAELQFCNLEDGAQIDYRFGNPDIEQSPVSLELFRIQSSNVHSVDKVTINDSSWKKLTLDIKDGVVPNSPSSYRVKISKLWSPANGKMGGDSRWLGARFRFAGNICKE